MPSRRAELPTRGLPTRMRGARARIERDRVCLLAWNAPDRRSSCAEQPLGLHVADARCRIGAMLIRALCQALVFQVVLRQALLRQALGW